MGATVSSLLHWFTFEKTVAIGIPLGLGTVIGFLQAGPTTNWYPTLDKPGWTPPAPLFGQLWSVFYAVMGWASYLIWRQGGFAAQKRPLTLYGLQLAFNLLWPITFFIRKKLGQAQIVNLATLALASATVWEFYKVDAFAGKILIPYLLWLTFANALNYSIWKKNPGAGAPISSREGLHDSADKKNPGEEGYGGLQGRATASYSPDVVRNRRFKPAKSAVTPAILSQPFSLGHRLPKASKVAATARRQPSIAARHAASRHTVRHMTAAAAGMPRMAGCIV